MVLPKDCSRFKSERDAFKYAFLDGLSKSSITGTFEAVRRSISAAVGFADNWTFRMLQEVRSRLGKRA